LIAETDDAWRCDPDANARLIAAAPDLLRERDALREVLRAILDAEDMRSEPGCSDDPEALADLYLGLETARAALGTSARIEEGGEG